MPTVMTPPPRTRACPKCAYVSDLGIEECPACGVVIDKAIAADEQIANVRDVRPTGEPLAMLAEAERLSVKQDIERLEAWTGIETANQYTIRDGMGRVLFDAAEESDSTAAILGRLFLKAARPFTLHLITADGRTALTVKRPFRFYFHEVSVHDAQGRCLGTVQRQFSIINKRYVLRTTGGGETYEAFGPLWRPWTFKIRFHGQECGLISKKWSGLFKETITDADNFGVQLPPNIGVELKAVFLGAVFLIDFVHFEDNHN
jgi:uncharacterized protein YxjI